MATTDQINAGGGEISSFVDRYVGDDWRFSCYFSQGSTPLDMSSYTFTASLITEPGGVYTTLAISGGNGSIDVTLASSGYVYVTVSDTATSVLTPDMDAPDVATSTQTTFQTRLALLSTKNAVTKTEAIVPIRVIRR